MSKRHVVIDTGRDNLVVRLDSGWHAKLVARCRDPEEARRIIVALDPDHAQEELPDVGE